jgi:uncharacterized membrane protein
MQVMRQMTGTRMLGIDAARGMAMLFSCLAHFGWWIEHTHPWATGTLSSIGMVATPTFLLLSGTVTGWLCRKAAEDPQDTAQWKLLNRGLFLLTLGHVLVSLAEAHRDGLVRALSGASIIDDIGLCMVCCALWFPALKGTEFRRRLVTYGIAGYLLCWFVILAWHSPVGGWLMLQQALLGPDVLGVRMHSYSSPLLPYMCLFAIGLGSSDYLVAAAQTDSPRRRRSLFTLGGALVASALLLRGARWLVEREYHDNGLSPLLSSTLSISGKLPPAPAYVLFYCGIGLTISSVMFALAASRMGIARRIAELVATLGRASLFVFILQYFIFWTLPDLLGITPSNTHLALIFIAGLSVNWLAAWCWNRMRGNRFLTLGIKPPTRRPDGNHISRHASGRGITP